MSINQQIHFSDWVIGHSHLAMLGFATFAAAGGLIHAWRQIPWARYNAEAMEAAYWLLTAGVILMFADLTIAGLIEGNSWASGAPWLDSIRAVRSYWLFRTMMAIPITLGFLAMLMGMTTGPKAPITTAEEQIAA